MTTLNDIDAIYDEGLIYSESEQTYTCPVCDKVYKCQSAAETHLLKRDCYSLKDIFDGTAQELRGYDLYATLIAKTNPRARVTVNTFRKSNYYTPVMRFLLFVDENELNHLREVYIDWLIDYANAQHINSLLSVGIRPSVLKEFRIFAQAFSEILIDSETFFRQYREDFLEDSHFFLRSLEKAHIGLSYVANIEEGFIESIYTDMPIVYQDRVDVLVAETEAMKRKYSSSNGR